MYSALSIDQDAVIHVDKYVSVSEGEFNSLFFPDSAVKERRQKEKEDRLSLVIWRRPITTLHYFVLETLIKLNEWTFK